MEAELEDDSVAVTEADSDIVMDTEVEVETEAEALSVADCDGDNDIDIFVAAYAGGNWVHHALRASTIRAHHLTIAEGSLIHVRSSCSTTGQASSPETRARPLCSPRKKSSTQASW